MTYKFFKDVILFASKKFVKKNPQTIKNSLKLRKLSQIYNDWYPVVESRE